MNWINPPEAVRRFSIHGIVQHWLSAGLFLVLFVSAVLSICAGGVAWKSLHVRSGLVAAAVLAYHVVCLVAVGIRYNVPPDKVAFFPSGPEWRVLLARGGASCETGKYAPAEKWDYLCILAWSLAAAASGVFLRWPGRFGVPGPQAFAWLKAAHAGAGAALLAHVLANHVPARWLRQAGPFRAAILTGRVPLEAAESRPGWVADLVAAGALVPAPVESQSEDATETRQVRELLEQGNLSAKEGRYADACAAFERALELLPSYSQARFNLAVARMKQGRADQAAEQLRQFIALDPFNPMAEKARELLESVATPTKGDAP